MFRTKNTRNQIGIACSIVPQRKVRENWPYRIAAA
jgi:hypothetical protein